MKEFRTAVPHTFTHLWKEQQESWFYSLQITFQRSYCAPSSPSFGRPVLWRTALPAGQSPELHPAESMKWLKFHNIQPPAATCICAGLLQMFGSSVSSLCQDVTFVKLCNYARHCRGQAILADTTKGLFQRLWKHFNAELFTLRRGVMNTRFVGLDSALNFTRACIHTHTHTHTHRRTHSLTLALLFSLSLPQEFEWVWMSHPLPSFPSLLLMSPKPSPLIKTTRQYVAR